MKKCFAIAGILAVSLCAFGVAACGEEGGGGQTALRAEVTDAEWTTAFDLKTTNCTIKVTSHAEGETEEGLDSYVDYTMYILESGEMQTVTVNEGKTQKAYSVSEGGKNYVTVIIATAGTNRRAKIFSSTIREFTMPTSPRSPIGNRRSRTARNTRIIREKSSLTCRATTFR